MGSEMCIRDSRITYTLEIAHDGTSTGPAYDLVVNDTLGAGLNLVAGSVVITGSGASNAVLVNDNGSLQIDISLLEQGQTINVSYEAIADDSVRVTDELINSALLDYDTAAGDGGRGFTLGDEETFTVIGTPTIDCLLYTSPSPRDLSTSRMPSSA